jgi:hypothetical protein
LEFTVLVVRGWSFAMTDPVDLTVKVLNSEIVISRPETGDEVTFRKDGPVLTSLESMRTNPDRARVQFLVLAWKAAHAKACQLGWLRS